MFNNGHKARRKLYLYSTNGTKQKQSHIARKTFVKYSTNGIGRKKGWKMAQD